MANIPLSEKYMLTIKEAAVYFGIGMKRIRSLADEHLGEFSVTVGDRRMIIRVKFEEYILNNPVI